MVTRVSVDHTVRNISVKSLRCTPETHIILYVDYIAIKKKRTPIWLKNKQQQRNVSVNFNFNAK